MQTALATPQTAAKKLSGRYWTTKFEGSTALSSLDSKFRRKVDAFVGALRNAGANVRVAATTRSCERAYLMHWSWRIVKQGFDPEKVPPMRGVDIQWWHTDADNSYSRQASVGAALAMVQGFGKSNLGVAPALESRHIAGCAIDMKIDWRGDLTILDAKGKTVAISDVPRTGLNRALQDVGATYGVIKYNRRGRDDPHWSDTGA